MIPLVFTHASLWPFLLALGFPLWLHLRRRRSRRTQVLPTFALLQKALGAQTPLLRWRQILLLVSRLLILLFLLCAFLKPTIPAALERSNGQGRAVVFLLDTSLSMGATRGGASALERAKGRTMALLDDLRQGDTANVILLSTLPHPVLPHLSGDFGTLRQAVRNSSPNFERGNPYAAIALAMAELNEANAPRRELIVVSDFQKTDWTPDSFNVLPSEIKLVLLAGSDAPPENAAITGLRLPTLLPAPGEPAPITAQVWNGSASSRCLTVSLTISRDDGQPSDILPIAPQTVTVPPFGSADAVFSVTFPAAARYRLIAKLPEDALPAANARYAVADLKHRLNVLLLTDSTLGSRDGATYLRQALNPTPELPGGFRVVVRKPASLSMNDLRTADVVLCSEIESFPAARMGLLTDYVQRGGAAIYFLANPEAISQIAALAKRAPNGTKPPFVPETYLDVRELSPGFLALNPPRSQSPLLRLFTDPSTADLTKIAFTRYCLTAPTDSDAEILLTFHDGTPALARWDFGKGTFLLCNFSASPLAGDLAKQTLFPPLIHEWTQGMATQNAAQTEVLCGGTAAIMLDAGTENDAIHAFGPEGTASQISHDMTGDATLANLSRPGFYGIAKDGTNMETAAVNVPPEEADLRPSDWQKIPAGRDAGSSHVVGTSAAAMEVLRHDVELWPYCILLALGFLLLEGWLCREVMVK